MGPHDKQDNERAAAANHPLSPLPQKPLGTGSSVQNNSVTWGVATTAEDGATAVTEAERRRSHRTRRAASGILFAPSGETGVMGLSVEIRDLSLDGMGLLCSLPLKVGNIYAMRVASDWLNLTSRLSVISCRSRIDGHYDVGAEFC